MPEAGQPVAPVAQAGRPSSAGAAGPAGADEAGPPRQARGRGRAWALGVGLFVLAVVALWFCYLRVSRTQRVESDGASIALQGWDVLHGNLLLHGWTVPDVLFYTVETPRVPDRRSHPRLNADALHVVAAFNYALLVVLAAVLARGRTTGREAVVRMLIAAGIMLAPEPGPGVFIGSSQRITSPPRSRCCCAGCCWSGAAALVTPVAIGVLLTWTAVGNQVVWFTGLSR